MIKLTIDNLPVEVAEGTTILDAAKTVGVFLPTLCHLKGVNEIGACRICVAEIEGSKKLVTTCNTPVSEGMVVLTNSPRAWQARMTNLQLMLSQHNADCATCIRGADCDLLKKANELGVISMPYEKKVPASKWDMSNALIRDNAKCIKCMRCVQICKNIQRLGVWGLDGTGARTCVDVSHGRSFGDSDCTLCGQCVKYCPTGALSVRDDTDKIFRALADPEKITVLQISPSVFEAWCEKIGMSGNKKSAGKLVSALRKMGFDYIYDTSFSADLTIMEESGRFIKMFANRRPGTRKEEDGEFIKTFTETKQREFPLLTSACPAAVSYIKTNWPEFIDNLSTAKSPQQMFGVLAKTHIAGMLGVDPAKIFSISVAACPAKKAENMLPGMNSTGTGPDIDLVLTSEELERMVAAEHIQPLNLSEEPFDVPEDIGPGSGVTVSAAGGFMEASLRTVYYHMTGKFADFNAFVQVHERDGWREASFDIAGSRVRVAVAAGLKGIQNLMEALKRGTAAYDYVEIMACPGGCTGDVQGPDKKLDGLYAVGKNSVLNFLLDNPSGSSIYEKLANRDAVQKIQHLLSVDHKAKQQ